MPKRISITLLLTVVVAIVALFAATEAMAFCDYCDPPDRPPPEVSVTNSGWTTTLKSITEIGTGIWDWHYTAKDSANRYKGINYLAMLIPDCCTGAITVYEDHEQNEGFKWVFDVAQGEPTNCFGCYNEQAFVVKGTPDNSIDWHLITNTNQMSKSTILLSVKRLGPLTYEMAVPGCFDPDPQIVAGTSTTHTVTEGANSCTIEITEGSLGASVALVSGTCSFEIVSRGKYGGKSIEKIPLRIWMQRTSSPGCWYYTLPNGEDCQVCWYW